MAPGGGRGIGWVDVLCCLWLLQATRRPRWYPVGPAPVVRYYANGNGKENSVAQENVLPALMMEREVVGEKV